MRSEDLNQEQFSIMLRERATSAIGKSISVSDLARLLPIICAARPFVMFPDSYSGRDVRELEEAVGEFPSRDAVRQLEALRRITQEIAEPAPGDLPDTFDALLQMICLEVDSEYERAEQAEQKLSRRGATAEALWQLLDNIDTLSDSLKPSWSRFSEFYRKAMDIVKQRHALLQSDGYTLTWPGLVPGGAPDQVKRRGVGVETEDDVGYWRRRYEELCAGIERALTGEPPACAYDRNRTLTLRVLAASEERGDQSEIDRITEMFHPDMSYGNVRAAIGALFNVFREVREVRLGTNVMLTNQEHLRKRVSECHSLLWEKVPTQLERENEHALYQAEVDAGLATDYQEQYDALVRGGVTGRHGGAWSAATHHVTGEPKVVLPEVKPVPMLLSCPVCYTRHFDEGEFATKPHHTHACQGFVVVEGKRRRCGHVWRPALVPTVGVEALPGFLNS